MSHKGPFKFPSLNSASAPYKRTQKKKKRKEKDGEWSRRYQKGLEKKRKLQKAKKSIDAHAVPISQLNGIMKSPAKVVTLIAETGIGMTGVLPFEDLQAFTASTPGKGVLTSSLKNDDVTLLRARSIKSHKGTISIFLSEDKVEHVEVSVPSPPSKLKQTLKKLGFPESKNDSIIDVHIALKDLKDIRSLKSKRKKEAESERQPSNQQAAKVPANSLAKALGLDGHDWQWWHMACHSLWNGQEVWGDISQTIDNFILGKKHGNSKMYDLAEGTVQLILKEMNLKEENATLYLSVQVEWVPGFEAARLANKLIWTLRDGPQDNYNRMVSFEFNPLSTATISQSEIDKTKDLLLHLFLEDKPVEIKTPEGKELPLKSPGKPLKARRFEGATPVPFVIPDKDAPALTPMYSKKRSGLSNDEQVIPPSPYAPPGAKNKK